jgi:hypothetical protein
MSGPDATDTARTRRPVRIAVIAGITLVVLIVLAVGIYIGVFVVLSLMMG